MAVKRTHSTAIDGVVDFAEWLDEQQNVKDVLIGNVRSRKIRPGARVPSFRIAQHSVEVFYYAGGQLQVLHVFAVHPMKPPHLKRLLKQRYEERQQRGGCGMSPHDPVSIPESIKRRMAHGYQNGSATAHGTSRSREFVATSMEGATVATDTAAPNAVRQKVSLTTMQAEAYAYVLSLGPSGEPAEFTIDKVNAQLMQKFGQPGNGMYTALKKKGLILPQARLGAGFDKSTRSIIIRREVEPSSYHAPVARKRAEQKLPSHSLNDTALDHLKFFSRHQAVLDEAELRRKALAKQGFEIIDVKGRLALVPQTKKLR